MRCWKCWLLTAMLFVVSPAYAAKMLVTWTAPTTNTDGSPLTDLAGYIVTWGACNGGASIGAVQSTLSVKDPSATSSWIYPTGLTKVCVSVMSVNAAGITSQPSNVASGIPPAAPTNGSVH